MLCLLVQSVAFPALSLPLFFLPHLQILPMQSSIQTLTIVFLLLRHLSSRGQPYILLRTLMSSSFYLLPQLCFPVIFQCHRFILHQLPDAHPSNFKLCDPPHSISFTHCFDEKTRKVSTKEFIIGFLCTIGASAGYALLLSLMQLSFEKVLKRETFSVVLEMQIWTSVVASSLFARGEVKGLREEMEGFGRGRGVFVLTLVGTALCWQVYSVGVVGLIYVVSPLFSDVVGMLSLPLVPVAAVFCTKKKMDAVKIVALILAILSFTSYIYRNYLAEAHASSTPDNSISEQR